MNPRNIVALCGLFLLFGYEAASSTLDMIKMDIYRNWRHSIIHEDLCTSNCCKPLKPSLVYISELIDQIKTISQAKIDMELSKRLSEIDELKVQVRVNNRHIENLNRTNEIFRLTIEELRKANGRHRESVKEQTDIAKINEFITNTINIQRAEIKDLKLKLANRNKNSLIVKQLERKPKASCKGLPTGIYMIKIPGVESFPALCNGDIADGGWMVIHRRFDGSENFQRNWTDFRNGFGRLDGEFFTGLELLHRITNSGTYELYVEIKYFNGTNEFATYDNFTIGNEITKYKLESLGKFKGTAVNQMRHNLHQKFSTIEQDNDKKDNENCALTSSGASWYNHCWGPNFNGIYYDHDVFGNDTISWYQYDSLKSTQMLIRPKSKN